MSNNLRGYASYLSKIQDTRKQIRPILQSRRRPEVQQKQTDGPSTPSSKEIILEQYVKFHSTFSGLKKSKSSSELGLQRLTHRSKTSSITTKKELDPAVVVMTEFDSEETQSLFEERIATSLEKIEAGLAAFKKENTIQSAMSPRFPLTQVKLPEKQIKILYYDDFEILKKTRVFPVTCQSC